MSKIMESKITFWLPDDLRDKIRAFANERRWGTAQTVRYIIEEFFKNHE